MTKKDMAKAIAQEMGLTQAQVQQIVHRVFNHIVETLVEEGRIELRNFGPGPLHSGDRGPRPGQRPEV